MAGTIPDSPDYDFESEKKLDIVKVQMAPSSRSGRIYNKAPAYPMDSEAGFVYFSRMDGFVPVEVAVDTLFSPAIDYGASGFEGVRLQRTRYGDGFIELPFNLRRLAYTSLAFDLSLVSGTIALSDDPNVERIEHLQRTPKEFFDDARNDLDRDISMGVDIIMKDGSKRNARVPFKLQVRFSDGDRYVSPREFQAVMCSMAILNKLVRGGAYPESDMSLVKGGYFRPGFSISGEEGLKVPTAYVKDGQVLFRPKYLKVGTLPWGPYLPEEGYAKGLDVLIGPFPRADVSMPVWQKVGGVYVNSARNINIAMILGYGEILACNHDDRIVEGSAENIVILMTHKETGKMKVYFPPLSANILAGTTRDRVLRILEKGMAIEGKRIDLVMEAPKRKYLLECLGGETKWDVSAIVMMGTGVGLIHVKSITYNPKLQDWMGLNELRSEEVPADPLVLRKINETEQRFPVNGGIQHPFVAALKKAYADFALEGEGKRITPAYDMDYRMAERIFSVPLEEAASKDFIAKAGGGYFKERIDGVKHPDELKARYKEAIRTIFRMNDLSQERKSVPAGARTK
jgi:branched-subunit amino acid aminotransferase/4-amino-4-deoxychorismate lyase